MSINFYKFLKLFCVQDFLTITIFDIFTAMQITAALYSSDMTTMFCM